MKEQDMFFNTFVGMHLEVWSRKEKHKEETKSQVGQEDLSQPTTFISRFKEF